jgi:UDP-glucose 4-epimerase
MAKDALVTGAYGFIGRHLARRLAASGWRVTGVGHGAWSRNEWKAWGLDEWHQADVTLESLITYGGAPSAVFHCAGSGAVGFSLAHPHQDYLRTTHTTASMLEYVRLYVPRAAVVLLSSAAVYGISTGLPISESTPLLPVSPYGVHKRLAEELCLSYARQYGLSAAAVRFFSVYGPGLRKQLLWDACSKFANRDASFFGTGAEQRDWVHVDDGTALLMLAAQHASNRCPIVNGGSGTAVTVREVLEHVASSMGDPPTLSFSGAGRPGDPVNYQADISLAAGWGWRPQIDWRSGMQGFVDWFRAGAP